MKHSKLLLTLAISAVSASLANAQEGDGTIEEVTIVGSREQAQRIAGSAHYWLRQTGTVCL